MMKNKKLMALISVLTCLAVCFSLLFTACGNTEGATEAPSEPQGTTAPEETKDPEGTAPTEPNPTEPTSAPTAPPTEPDPTDPEGPNDPTDPTDPAPTEPEPTEPPAIAVPGAGTENNAYTEQISGTSGSFKTVMISAGETVHYQLKTSGTYLYIENENASVTYNGREYRAENGVVKVELPADDGVSVPLKIKNVGTEACQFTVRIQDALGTVDNPVILDSIRAFSVNLTEGDTDGIYLLWIANRTGTLKLSLLEKANADIIVMVNGASCQLSEGSLQMDIKENDEVLLQVIAGADDAGNLPAMEVTAGGYVAQREILKITNLPKEEETVVIPAGESAFYSITINKNKVLTIANAAVKVVYNGITYTADAEGMLSLLLTDSGAEVEIYNISQEDASCVMQFSHPLGHQRNPQILSALDEISVSTIAGEQGYYLQYTAPADGLISFQIFGYPEVEYQKLDMIVTNETTGESMALWSVDENGDPVEGFIASVFAKAGDLIVIQVYVEDADGAKIKADLTLIADIYGSEEKPIDVFHPGFKAQVPVGKTLYYQAYNMGDMIFHMTAADVKVSHNGVVYSPESGQINFSIVVEGRTPAVFAITNTGTKDAIYEVSFLYPAGHIENPDTLLLGTNTVIRKADAQDYYYTFTAIRAGTLTLNFDPASQWVYAVDNMTKGIYGDTQWSDSDPLMAEITVEVAAGDVIRVRVNTYDASNPFGSPAGTVTFSVKYVTGPTAIENLTLNTNTTLIPGEYGAYTGQFYDYKLYIGSGKNLIVYYDGVAYMPNSNGEIEVPFPEADGSGNQPDLSFMVYNAGTASYTASIMFMGQEMGSMENPEVIGMGPHVMTQTQANGADYYYRFNATSRGTLRITITSNSNWVFQVNNLTMGSMGEWVMSTSGKNSYTISVRAGQSIEIVMNTMDHRTGASIVGTVEFTVSM